MSFGVAGKSGAVKWWALQDSLLWTEVGMGRVFACGTAFSSLV